MYYSISICALLAGIYTYSMQDPIQSREQNTPDTLQSLVLHRIALNKVSKPESLYTTVQEWTTQYPHLEPVIISNMCIALAKKSDEETQQQLFDFLYEKMFDVPLFKTYQIRDYTQDLLSWSNSDTAYKLYAALSHARGEKSCKNLFEEYKDELHIHGQDSSSIHNGTSVFGDTILDNVHSWHDMHLLLSNTKYFKDIFFDNCWQHRHYDNDFMHLCFVNQTTRLYLPLLEKCVATALYKKHMNPLKSIYVGKKRNMYNADFAALHSPIFDGRENKKNLSYGSFSTAQRTFELTIRLSNMIKLPVDTLSGLPLHLILDIQNVKREPTYLSKYYWVQYGDSSCVWDKKFEYYIFKPGWRLKKLVSAGILGILCTGAYWTWKYINQKHTEEVTKIMQAYQTDTEQILTTTINNHDQKLALKYVADTMPTSTLKQEYAQNLAQEYTKDIVINPKTVLSIENIEHAKNVIETLGTNTWNYSSQKIGADIKTYIYKAALIGSLVISSGIRLVADTLSLIAPSIFGTPQCTVKCGTEKNKSK